MDDPSIHSPLPGCAPSRFGLPYANHACRVFPLRVAVLLFYSAEVLQRATAWGGKQVFRNSVASMRALLEVPRVNGIAPTRERYLEVR